MKIPGWQLALRFGLELGALYAVATWAAGLVDGPLRWAAGLGAPLVLALVWGTFAVAGDPSRSGNAPVRVPGAVRLAIEVVVFLGGAAALAAQHRPVALGAFALGLVVHHAGTTARLKWLLRQ